MSRRRELSFSHLREVMPDVDRLLRYGYGRGGRWTLGQACEHVGLAVSGSLAGLPGHAPWLVRRTLGVLIRGQVLRSGRMPEGIRIKPGWKLMPGSDADDRAGVATLREAISDYLSTPGPLPEHPFFGPMSREQWDRLHCVHIAHHLSFLLPAAQPAGEAEGG